MLTRLNIDGFTIYTNAKSSCCTPETNAKLDVNYISKKTFFKAMSPVEQQRAQERRQVVWGQGHSQESSLHWIKSQKHFSISPQFYLTYHPNPNLRRVEELRTKALDLDCLALNPSMAASSLCIPEQVD